MLEEHFADGLSFESFAGVIGVAKQTIDNWLDKYPEFMDARKRFEGKSQLLWERRLASLATTGEGNATAIIFGLKNRASDSWRDVKSTEISGPAGGAINVKAEKAEWSIIDTATPSGT